MPSYGCVTNCGIKLAGIHFDNFSAIESIYYFAGSLPVLSRGMKEVVKLAASEKPLLHTLEHDFCRQLRPRTRSAAAVLDVRSKPNALPILA